MPDAQQLMDEIVAVSEAKHFLVEAKFDLWLRECQIAADNGGWHAQGKSEAERKRNMQLLMIQDREWVAIHGTITTMRERNAKAAWATSVLKDELEIELTRAAALNASVLEGQLKICEREAKADKLMINTIANIVLGLLPSDDKINEIEYLLKFKGETND